MAYLLLKALLSGAIIALASEVARRSSLLGAVLISPSSDTEIVRRVLRDCPPAHADVWFLSEPDPRVLATITSALRPTRTLAYRSIAQARRMAGRAHAAPGGVLAVLGEVLAVHRH